MSTYGKKKEKVVDEIDLQECLTHAKALQKVKIRKPTVIQTILRQRYQKRSVYYSTMGRKINLDLYKEMQNRDQVSPFFVSREIDDFTYRTQYKDEHAALRKQNNQYQYYNRPSYRSRLAEGKLERIHVPETKLCLPGKSLADDIDPEYFTIAAGRPIREIFDVREYMKDLQHLFLLRLETGYKYDAAYLIEEQYREEKKRFREIQEKYKMYAECYEKFLAEDHSSSIELLVEADLETRKSKLKREKIKQLLRDCGWYRTKILIFDEHWRKSKIFQKFLYQVSPLWWRLEHDYLHRIPGTHMIDTSDTSLYGKYRASSLAAMHSVVTIIDEFIEDICHSEPPLLYFKNAKELFNILYELERGNLLALLQCEELTPPAQQMVSDLEKARLHFKKELKVLTEELKDLEKEVLFEENRSMECEQKAKGISFGLFKDLIVDKYTLNLYVFVEDCYETCVAPNDSNLSLTQMMKGIEHKQEALMVSMDNLPNDIVVRAFQTCYKEDAKIMKEAYEATKLVYQIETLMKTLRKSLEPAKEVSTGRRLLWRSEPPMEKMEIVEPPKPLTTEQLEYLYFFTEFCPINDDHEEGKLLCPPNL